MNPKLKTVWREPEFWLLLIISLPGLALAVVTAALATWSAAQGGPISYDADAALLSLLGSPVIVYLGLGRQIARKGAAEGMGHYLAAQGELVNASNPPAEATVPMPAPESHEEIPEIEPASIREQIEGDA